MDYWTRKCWSLDRTWTVETRVARNLTRESMLQDKNISRLKMKH